MKRPLLSKLALILSISSALYALVLLPTRWTDLGLWLILFASLPPMIYGLWPLMVRAFTAEGWGRIVKIILWIGYGLLGVSFVVIASFIYSYSVTPPDKGADAIIVLGAGLKDGKPSAALCNRLDAAAGYATGNPDCLVLVAGGQSPEEPCTEASAMAEYLLSRGISSERILREEKSVSTYENFLFGKAILDAKLGRNYRVVFVTTDFHVMRASFLAKSLGFNAQGLSVRSEALFIPMYYVREYMVIMKYLIFGVDSLPYLSRIF
jgi:uncharacterized SAM-binding protein YcdF (DUF218 family)